MDATQIPRYPLPRNITKGIAWTKEGTINLGSTRAYLSANTPMPENDGNLYTWGETENLIGGHYVTKVGSVDPLTLNLLLDAAYFPVDKRLILTRGSDEILAIAPLTTLVIPAESILTTHYGTGNGQLIAVADALTPIYMGGTEGAKFFHLEGEGLILDNVTIADYSNCALRFSKECGTEVLTHIENCILDDFYVDSVHIEGAYTGKLNVINNTIEGIFEISALHVDALLDVRNNRMTELLLYGATDFSTMIRNNYTGVLSLYDGAICPVTENVGKFWHTIDTLSEMEVYTGNIVGSSVIPNMYGYAKNYGKIDIGALGGIPYLVPVERISISQLQDTLLKVEWDKKQPEIANSYRISLSPSLALFPTFVPAYIDTGDVSDQFLEGGKTVLDAYPDDNDGNQDGSPDPLLDLKLNLTWYFILQAQYKLGEKLSVHLSTPSTTMAVPVRDTGAKPPPYSVGFAFPVRIKDGNFLLAEKRDSVKAGLYQTVMTNVGERLLHEYGAGLRAFVFEGVMDESLLDIAREHVRNGVEALEPRIKIQGIYFRKDETSNGEPLLLVNIIYTDLESGETDNFSIGLGNYGQQQDSV